MDPSQSLFPPFRYGLVEFDIHRGAYPKRRNLRFLQSLGLKTILSLTPDPLDDETLIQFCTSQSIHAVHFRTEKPKESVPLSFPRVLQILQLLTEPANLPIYVHCLDGSTVTCIIIMALRKLQGWTTVCYTMEACRFLRDGVLSSEESEFMEKLTGEFEIPLQIPKWLWEGNSPLSSGAGAGIGTVRKHPFFKLKPNPIQQAIISASQGSTSSSGPPLSVTSSTSGHHSSAPRTHLTGIAHVESPVGSESPIIRMNSAQVLYKPSPLSAATLKLQQEKEELRRMAIDDMIKDSSTISQTDKISENESQNQNDRNVIKAEGNDTNEQEESISRTLEALDLEIL